MTKNIDYSEFSNAIGRKLFINGDEYEKISIPIYGIIASHQFISFRDEFIQNNTNKFVDYMNNNSNNNNKIKLIIKSLYKL
jgi:hypothetical protein